MKALMNKMGEYVKKTNYEDAKKQIEIDQLRNEN